MQLLQDSQGCIALLDAAPDVDHLCCWLPELDALTPADDVSSSLSDWMVGLSPRLQRHAAAAAAAAAGHTQASTKEGTLGVPPSALDADAILCGLNCQVPLDSPLGSSSAGNSSNFGSCSIRGVCGQLSPGILQQQQLATFNQQQQPQQQHPQQQLSCMDYCHPAPYGHMYDSISGFQHGPPGPSGYWPCDISTVAADRYAAAGPSFMGPGEAAGAGSYYTAGPYAPSAPYPGPAPYPASCLPAAAAPLGQQYHQGFPNPGQTQGLVPAAVALHGMLPAGYSCGPVSYPTSGPFTGPPGNMGYQHGPFPLQQSMQSMPPGSCAGPWCAYPPAACMDGQYYCPAPMSAQTGFLSGPLAGQLSNSGLMGHHCSSRSSLDALSGPAAPPSAAAAGGGGGGGGYLAGSAAWPAWEDVAASPAASAGQTTPSVAAAAASNVLYPAAQRTFSSGSDGKQQQQQQQINLSAPAAAAAAAQTATAPKAAKLGSATPRDKPAAAAVCSVQSGGVSKPALRGSAGAAKPFVSKTVKRRLLEEQQQCIMQDSAQKIKELAARKEKLTAITEQLQESRDRAAAALGKLREQYATIAADNTKRRSDNAELKALIDGIKARMNLSA